MKVNSTIYLIILFLISLSLYAQEEITKSSKESVSTIPSKLSYQGVLASNDGTPLDGQYDMQFRLFTTASGGTAIWTETQSNISVNNGIFNVFLGSVSSLEGITFDTPYWLEITVSGNTLTPRIELTSSAYSMRTRSVEDGSITSSNIASGQVVKSLNNFKDNVTIAAGSNITVTNSENTITISSSAGGGGESLSQTLAIGNSAGAYDIDMDSEDIINVDDIRLENGTGSTIYFYDGAKANFYNVAGELEGQIRSSSEGNYDQLEFWTDAGWFVWKDDNGDEVAYLEGISGASNNGNFWVLGDISANGTKNFIMEHPNDPSKEIVYVCLEGGEAGTYIRGSAELTNGKGVINLPEHFSLVTSDNNLTTQITPRENCNGIYVVSSTTKQIIVKELMDGKSNAKFDYFVQGIRKGYENYSVIRDKDKAFYNIVSGSKNKEDIIREKE